MSRCTASFFTTSLRHLISTVGPTTAYYSPPFFSPGRGTYAFQAGMPEHLLQLPRYWRRSDAYKTLLKLPLETRTTAADIMVAGLYGHLRCLFLLLPWKCWDILEPIAVPWISRSRLEMFCPISATKVVPVSPILIFEILLSHISSPPRPKIGQALSQCESALVLINNILTSETKAAKKEFLSVSCMPPLRIFWD